MNKRTIAIIVSVCKDCKKIIDAEAEDQISENGFWEEPVVGSKINADIITRVTKITPRNSHLPFYVVELDTTIAPHCEKARHRTKSN